MLRDEQSVSLRWAEIVERYRELHPRHRQEPMTALVLAVAEAGVKNNIWPGTSHFDLSATSYDAEAARHYPLPAERPSVFVVYWQVVDKFKLHCYNIQGVPYDIKWCELAEAQATMRYLFRIMGQAD